MEQKAAGAPPPTWKSVSWEPAWSPSAPAGLKQLSFGFELLLQIHPRGQAREGTGTEGPPWAGSLCCPLRQQKVSKFSPNM